MISFELPLKFFNRAKQLFGLVMSPFMQVVVVALDAELFLEDFNLTNEVRDLSYIFLRLWVSQPLLCQ
ncbi:hypothetical protein ColLi_12262 [Colletotrichum liriopes]|uniref:Uncharacterized protein n=1 Tax=Colletotrichum liriopes TaxID=708192 RepID=A0AA37LYL4_9PEZI|nr:hypothetical protein ColLi_12262 [Colletotrichum liriopes]